jgi:hypothetical protein
VSLIDAISELIQNGIWKNTLSSRFFRKTDLEKYFYWGTFNWLLPSRSLNYNQFLCIVHHSPYSETSHNSHEFSSNKLFAFYFFPFFFELLSLLYRTLLCWTMAFINFYVWTMCWMLELLLLCPGFPHHLLNHLWLWILADDFIHEFFMLGNLRWWEMWIGRCSSILFTLHLSINVIEFSIILWRAV